MSLTYAQFMGLFPEKPRAKAGKGERVICPAHEDRNPSLWVESPSNGDFTVDFHCLAGCTKEAVLAALKLTWADVMVKGAGKKDNTWRTTASYVYELEAGKQYYVIDRQEDGAKKKFTAKHQVDDTYVFDLEGLQKILYRQPELKEAVKAGKPILIPEGEGKVERLRALGFEATTNPFGAGKWNDSYTQELAGADVVIPPDYDPAGLAFAEQKARALFGTATRFRVLQLTDVAGLQKLIGKQGVDITDWLDAGHTKEELQILIGKAPDWKPESKGTKPSFHLTRLGDLLKEPAEEVAYLWDNTLIRGGLSILVAKPKVGKSTLARNLVLAVARGEPSFLGRSITSSGPIVYLALEEKRSEVRKHFERMGVTENLPIFIHTGSAPEQALDELRKAVLDNKAVLAIVDPLQRLVRIPDLNDYSKVSLALEPLMQIARDSDCHILLVHHANKGIAREGGDSILGSTAIFGGVDCALIMKRTESCRTIESIQRYGEDLPRTVLAFDLLTGLTTAAGTLEDVEMAECRKVIVELLADHEATEKEIKDGITDYKGGTVSASLRTLCQEGKAQRKGLGKKGDPYLYSIAENATKNAGDSRDEHMQIPTIPTIPSISVSFKNDLFHPDDSAGAEKTYPHNFKDENGVDRRESLLRIPMAKVLEIWRKEGAPVVHLGPCENTEDLEGILSNPDCQEYQLRAIREWLDRVLNPKTRPILRLD